MPERTRPQAQSRYKQLRLQFTEEIGGRISCSLYVKPLNAQWNEHHCVQRWSRQSDAPLDTLEDAIGVLLDLLHEDVLPGIG